jgi:2-hydroxy-3-keto-5-methylthiopentenyl-1-phosphate phosphatase
MDKERKRKLAVICDFDGTVTTVDIAEAILKKFTGDGWYQFEKDYRAGKLASREALRRQFALVKATKGQIIGAALDSAKITPGFEDFVRYCQSRSIPFVVLSEGLDFYIERILASTGVDVEWHSNMGRFKENGLEVEFLDNVEECNSCGNCKLGRLKAMRKRGWEIVYIGDGHSDLCPAQVADHVLAKGALLTELRKRGVRCTKFGDFRDCARYLEGLK